MSVYVDTMEPTEPSKRWPYKESCHMFADSTLELDDMAHKMGLNPKWKQQPLTYAEHYDLTANRRRQAIGYGAQPVTRREMGHIMNRKLERGQV